MNSLEFTWGESIFRWEDKEKIFKGYQSTWTATAWPNGLTWRGRVQIGDCKLPVGNGRTPQEAMADSLRQMREALTNLESKITGAPEKIWHQDA
jgi:hypothetical protein